LGSIRAAAAEPNGSAAAGTRKRDIWYSQLSRVVQLNHVQFENRSSFWMDVDEDDRRLP
jgi:hypothetical protein